MLNTDVPSKPVKSLLRHAASRVRSIFLISVQRASSSGNDFWHRRSILGGGGLGFVDIGDNFFRPKSQFEHSDYFRFGVLNLESPQIGWHQSSCIFVVGLRNETRKRC